MRCKAIWSLGWVKFSISLFNIKSWVYHRSNIFSYWLLFMTTTFLAMSLMEHKLIGRKNYWKFKIFFEFKIKIIFFFSWIPPEYMQYLLHLLHKWMKQNKDLFLKVTQKSKALLEREILGLSCFYLEARKKYTKWKYKLCIRLSKLLRKPLVS